MNINKEDERPFPSPVLLNVMRTIFLWLEIPKNGKKMKQEEPG